MKILLVRTPAGFLDVEGPKSYNLQEIGLARALNKKGHKCDVVYFGGKKTYTVSLEYDKDGNTFDVFYLKGLNILHDSYYFGINYLADKYDIIHSDCYDTIQSFFFAKKYHKKLIIYNGTYYSEFNKNYNKKCFFVDKLFVPRYKKYNVTFDTKSRLSEQFLRSKGIQDITTIGVGIDLTTIEYSSDSNSPFVDKITALKQKGYQLILYVGRIEPRRNIKFLLDLLKEICNRQQNIKLVVIGNGDRRYLDEIFKYARDNRISEYVIYQQFLDQSHLKYVYEICDVFVLPTLYEIFGMVILEAMYYKMPVVTTMNGGSCMLIEDGVCGYIVDKFDVKKWSDRILHILQNTDMLADVGIRAKKVVSEQFTWDALADKFIALFERKLSQNH